MKQKQRSLAPSRSQSSRQPANSSANGAPGMEASDGELAVASQQDGLLTLSEVAALLRCSKAHVSNLIRDRVTGSPPLPAVRLGRRVCIRRGALERYLRLVEARYDGGGQDSAP